MTRDECRKIYEPYWKGDGHPEISDEAIDLVLLLSRVSISGFEGADLINLTPALDTALSRARQQGAEAERERIEAGLFNPPPPVTPQATELTLEDAAARDNYCPRCRMVNFNPTPPKFFCECGDEAWDCCADVECSSCGKAFAPSPQPVEEQDSTKGAQ